SKADLDNAPVAWTIRGTAAGRGRGPATPRYVVSGPGVEPEVSVAGNTISIKGMIPGELAGIKELNVLTETLSGTPATMIDFLAVRSDKFATLQSPELDLSSTTKKDGPFRVAYEGFHWLQIPRAQDVACSIITTLGDKFDFIASYSDFRVDN